MNEGRCGKCGQPFYSHHANYVLCPECRGESDPDPIDTVHYGHLGVGYRLIAGHNLIGRDS